MINKLDYPFDSAFILLKKKALKKELLNNGNFIQKKIAILSGSTIGEIKDILELFLLKFGIQPVFFEGNYNNYFEDVMFENKLLKEFNPDIIYIHTSNRNIELYPDINDSNDDIENMIDNQKQKYFSLWNKIKQDYNSTIIQNNFELSSIRMLGNKDCYDIHGRNSYINRLNNVFYDYARENNDFYINDINYLSSWYGLEKWSDFKYWYLYKYCLNVNAIPTLSHNIAKIIKSLYGKNQKCMVLDLDNTLWGGVIGECGVQAIELGKETALGYAYTEFQQYLKDISKLGVSICIASKNEYSNVIAGLSHPFSILKEHDFLNIKADWNNKAENIYKIASDINIGLSSILFIDDNPAEREIVKTNLKDIEVLNTNSINNFIKYIDQSGYFEITTISEDDFNRNQYYKNINKSKNDISMFVDYKQYLKSLDMKVKFDSFNNIHLERITQLINKTNQFNLTTLRLSFAEVQNIANHKDYMSIYAIVEDKYGSNGLVTLMFGKMENDLLDISLWIMSCRVFKRNLEYALFDEVIRRCKDFNIKRIKGTFIPTDKNKIVENFYLDLGFDIIQKTENKTEYIYEIQKSYKNKNNIIKIE